MIDSLTDLWRYRDLITLFAALLVLGGIAARRSPNEPGESGLPADVFWCTKAAWRSCADVVVAGDSTVYRGVSPAAMASILPGMRIFNYGFAAIGYGREYLEAIEDMLAPDGGAKIIVLGLNPPAIVLECNVHELINIVRRLDLGRPRHDGIIVIIGVSLAAPPRTPNQGQTQEYCCRERKLVQKPDHSPPFPPDFAAPDR